MDDLTFSTPEAALEHYRTECASLAAQLADANADITDYTESSKELQDELEKELASMEKGEREMRKGLEEARGDMEEWKSKYTTSLREHTATMTHMQRELESLRTSENSLRMTLRDMELDNDVLENSEREKDSSLQDLENRYGKSIERIALLEEELVNKAQLEEEVQRLKDDLRDLTEEMSVLRSHTSNHPAYPRPLTPPDTLTQAPRTLSASLPSALSSTTPPSTPSPQTTPRKASSPFTTPRKSSTLPRPPSISLVLPAPARPSTTAPPAPVFHAPITIGAAALSRSTKALNLASSARPTTTPKAVRERRADGMIKDMKEMTDRVKQLTSRLDSRRNLVMAGSGIPRASMSPQTGGMTRSASGMVRNGTGKRGSTLGQSQLGKSMTGLGMSIGVGGRMKAEREKERDGEYARMRRSEDEGPSLHSAGWSESSTTSTISSRPPSRNALRASTAGHRTSIPVRPPSRMSSLSASTAGTCRPPTPSLSAFPARSPTPSSNRPAWGSNQNQPTNLAASTRRRNSSAYGNNAPGAGRSSVEMRRPPSVEPPARRPKSTDREGSGLGSSVRNGIARRASLALGRSVMRNGS